MNNQPKSYISFKAYAILKHVIMNMLTFKSLLTNDTDLLKKVLQMWINHQQANVQETKCSNLILTSSKDNINQL